MKTTTKLIFTILVLIIYSKINIAQTNISGTISTNTTWTKANSPYIVTSTVTVDPGYTLTIQPGVIVKFNGGKLIINRSHLIAKGLVNDSIIFTSNKSNPQKGDWSQIELNGGPSSSPLVPPTHNFIFEYCKIEYSEYGIYSYISAQNSSSYDSLFVKNSSFSNNKTGSMFQSGGKKYIDNSNFNNNNTGMEAHDMQIDNCNISNNGKGFYIIYGNKITNSVISNNTIGFDYLDRTTIDNCIIRKNATGVSQPFLMNVIKNSIIDSNTVAGIHFFSSSIKNIIEKCTLKYNATGIIHTIQGNDIDEIRYNIFENNGKGVSIGNSGNTINLYCNKLCNNTQYDLELVYNGNANVANNYWCSNNSSVIASHIYDGYDNTNYGIATFAPFDTLGCYQGGSIGVLENTNSKIDFSIYPNPVSDKLNIDLSNANTNNVVSIYNLLGQLQFTSMLTNDSETIDVSFLAKGVYVIEIKSQNSISQQKFIKQ